MRNDLEAADAAMAQAHWMQQAIAATVRGDVSAARSAVTTAIRHGADAIDLARTNRIANLVSEAQRELVWMDDILRQEEALNARPRTDR